jgi:hypothetical protein
MTYSELVSTDDLSESVPTKINENFRKRSFLNAAAMSASFTVWADDSAGDPTDIYLVTTASSTIVATLPAAASADAAAGRVVTIMKVDSGGGSVTIDGDGSETINGATTVSLASQYNYRTIVSNGTTWFVMGSS